MNSESIANVAIKPNVWCQCAEHVDEEGDQDDSTPPFFLKQFVPGDLLVELLGTRDKRTLESELNERQLYEYRQSRFFQNKGQLGIAFEGDTRDSG